MKTFFILFTYITLFHYSITSPVLFTENNKPWNERKEDFLCTPASAYQVISKEEENRVMETISDAHVRVKNHIDKVVEL